MLNLGFSRLASSFSTVPGSNESDLRTLYCAFAVSSMLNDWSGVNVPRAIAFINTCRVYFFFGSRRGHLYLYALIRLTKADMGNPLFVKHKVGLTYFISAVC